MNNTKKQSRMHTKIFTNILFVCAIILVASVLLLGGVLFGSYRQVAQDALEEETGWLSGVYETSGADVLKTLNSSRRITLIAGDGTVLYDNQADAATMPNHAARTEVQAAETTGSGFARRYSETLSEETINAARRLKDGNILRVSDTQDSVFSLIANAAWWLFLIVLSGIILAFILAYRVARSITKPINEMNLEHPDADAVYEELTPLVKRVDAQNRQIASQMEDLKEEHEKQDTMRREFTANVSHELKTPLTSISGYAELIHGGIAKPEDISRFAGKIYEESQRLITLVGDIIKLSQLDGKEVPVRIETINLYETCQAVLRQLELPAAEKHVTMFLDGQPLAIRGAEQIVEEIIFNICDNAVKYNVDGGRVDISIKQCVDGVELTVKDTGIGIPKEDLSHIFERFYRVDKSHSKEIGGTGLGLSIVKHGLMFMDAKVSVESEVGVGTSIRVLF